MAASVVRLLPPLPAENGVDVKFWYDTEFIEDGQTIDLISIGIVAEDGREYYAVSLDMPTARVRGHKWLMENVVPHLPPAREPWELYNTDDPLVKLRVEIAEEVRRFLLVKNEPVELWGYYSSYDHVLLAQLYGVMMNLPKGFPMWTNDVQQEAVRLGLDGSLPPNKGNAHNALDDARWTRQAWEYLEQHKTPSICTDKTVTASGNPVIQCRHPERNDCGPCIAAEWCHAPA